MRPSAPASASSTGPSPSSVAADHSWRSTVWLAHGEHRRRCRSCRRPRSARRARVRRTSPPRRDRSRVRFPVDRFRDLTSRSRPRPDARRRSSPAPATAACASAARSRSHPGTEIPVPFGERRPLGQSMDHGSRHASRSPASPGSSVSGCCRCSTLRRSRPHRRTRRARSGAPRAQARVPPRRHPERRSHAVPPGRRHRRAPRRDRRADARRRS